MPQDEESQLTSGKKKRTRHMAVADDIDHRDPNHIEERITPDEFNAYGNGCFKCFCGPYADESCGYPPNTVKAILASIFAFSILGIVGFVVVFLVIQDQVNVAIGIIGSLFTVLATVTTAYFAVQKFSKPAQPVQK